MSATKNEASATGHCKGFDIKTTQSKVGIDMTNSKVTPETVKQPVRTAKTACDKALLEASTEALAMKMYRLIEIVRLAAFATGTAMPTKEADTSEVLHYVAEELQGISCDFTETIYGLARAQAQQ